MWNFRNALDRIDWSTMPVGFTNFPLNACGDISDILAEYLYSFGFADIDYVCGEKRNGKTHAWLEAEGLAIDITADQFDGIDEIVLIQNPDIWHLRHYRESERRKAGYKQMSGPAIPDLELVHKEVIRKLQQSEPVK